MKICPKCKEKHELSGVYCSRKCANSRKFTEDARRKKSIANKRYWNSLSEEERELKGKILSDLSPFSPPVYLESMLTQDWNVLGMMGKRFRVILEQEGKCNGCGISHWLGKRVTLDFHHKDGNRENNTRDNVEMLCPNCHSTTDTWCGRKNGKRSRQEQVVKYMNMVG